MRRALLITPPVKASYIKSFDMTSFDFIIGVDGGVDEALEAGIELDLAIGDFDSIESRDVLRGIKHIKLPTEKNDTDTLYAINYVKKELGYNVTILGGIGGTRVEHTYANIMLMYQFNNLVIESEYSTVFKLEKGTHLLQNSKYINYKYLSIFPLYNNTVISLSGFKYNLDNYNLNLGNITGISNQFDLSNVSSKIEVLENSIIIILHKKN